MTAPQKHFPHPLDSGHIRRGLDSQVPQQGTSNRRHYHRPPSFIHVTQLSNLIAEVRRHPHGVARADLIESLLMGRSTVDRRIRTAADLGLLIRAGRSESTGGRAPELWRFNPVAATILTLSLSYRSSTAALMSLDGEVLERVTWDQGVLTPPKQITDVALEHLRTLRTARPDLPDPWAVGVALPVPVDFRDGSIVMPFAETRGASWSGFPLRARLAEALNLPVWIDDEVNVLALAAATRVGAPDNLLYVRLSLGLGMGIVSGGKVHRGFGAASGEISHIQMSGDSGIQCRCGRRGCLETLVSGTAMEEAASRPNALRASSYLRSIRADAGEIHDTDVFRGVAEGDRVCIRIVTEAAGRLGVALAVLVTTYNPGEIVLGGDVSASGQHFCEVVSAAVRRRILPSASARLRVRMGDPDDTLVGACRLATDRILSPHVLHSWIALGSPAGAPELVTHRRQDA